MGEVDLGGVVGAAAGRVWHFAVPLETIIAVEAIMKRMERTM
jgi:hypothetical protein